MMQSRVRTGSLLASLLALALLAGCTAASGEDPEEALDRLLSIEPAAGQVVFAFDSADMGEDARLVVAQDPPNRAQLLESEAGELLVMAGDTDAVCFRLPGPFEWDCLQRGSDPLGEAGTLETVYGVQDLPDLAFDRDEVEVSSETILDRPATCLSGPRAGGVTDYVICVDDQTGILLRASGEGEDGPFRVDAVGYSDPSPALFQLPAEFAEAPSG